MNEFAFKNKPSAKRKGEEVAPTNVETKRRKLTENENAPDKEKNGNVFKMPGVPPKKTIQKNDCSKSADKMATNDSTKNVRISSSKKDISSS